MSWYHNASDPRIFEPFVREGKLSHGHNDWVWLWHLTPNSSDFLSSEEAFDKLPQCTIPEMQRSNLAPVILQLKALGIDNVLRFHFMSVSPAFCLECPRVNVGTLDRMHHFLKKFFFNFHLTHVLCACFAPGPGQGMGEQGQTGQTQFLFLPAGWGGVTSKWVIAMCGSSALKDKERAPSLVSLVPSKTWNPSRISPGQGGGRSGTAERVEAYVREYHSWGSQEDCGRAAGAVLVADRPSAYFLRLVSGSGIIGSNSHSRFVHPWCVATLL